MFFIPGQGAASATLRIEDIRHLIQKLTGMQLVFPSYTRPRPLLPVQVTLPAGLRSIQKPALLPHPYPPAPVQKPVMASSPPPPVLLPRPMIRALPRAPAIPPTPALRPHPRAPVDPPRPKLHTKPLTPVYPSVPTPGPSDPFLARLCIAGALAGVPVFFVARPVGAIVMIAFGAWWLVMMATENKRREMARESLKKSHEAECAQMDEEYEDQI